MSTLRRIWIPVAKDLGVPPGEPAELLYAVALAATDGDQELALRVHGGFAARFGLRELLTPRADRKRYAELPCDPLAGGGKPGRRAWRRATGSEPSARLVKALEATAMLAAGKRARGQWLDTTLPLHPTGNPAAVREERCVDCAWGHQTPAGLRCRRASRIIEPEQTGCACWEPPLSGDPDPCAPCGLCCRGVFDYAPIKAEEAGVLPEDLVETREDGSLCIPHDADGACRALSREAPWRCGVHATRPFVCRDFPMGGDGCCEARRLMGRVPGPPTSA